MAETSTSPAKPDATPRNPGGGRPPDRAPGDRRVAVAAFFAMTALALIASATVLFLAFADYRARERELQQQKTVAEAEIATARAKAADAAARAEAAHAESVRLGLELEKTRKALADMRQPRELSDEQKRSLLAVVKRWREIAETVRPGAYLDMAFASASDPDSQQYAMQFMKVFRDAGLPVALKFLGTAIETEKSESDLELAVPRGREERFQPFVDALVDEFRRAGLPVKLDVNPDATANRLTLIVLSKRR